MSKKLAKNNFNAHYMDKTGQGCCYRATPETLEIIDQQVAELE